MTSIATGQTRQLAVTDWAVNRLRNDFGTNRVLGHVGAGLNIALLPILEFSTKLLMSSRICLQNNFIKTNFGLRFALLSN